MSSRWIPPAAALAASLAVAAPAMGAISSPPAGGHEVTVFPERDFVALDPWTPNAPFRLELVRNGIVMTTADGTAGADGIAEVNHPGGFCWNTFTPDILPGDVLRAVAVDGTGTPILDGAGAPIGDATTTADAKGTSAAQVGSQLVVKGTARTAAGGPLPLGTMEQRIVQPSLLPFVNKRDIRAPGGGNGFSSTLSYDAPGSTNWTATYTGLSQAAIDEALAGDVRILSWMGTNAAGDRLGITIFEAGQFGGPGMGNCPGGARNIVTNPGVINGADLAAGAPDVVFKGAAQPDVTAVSLAVTDGTKTLDVPATVAGGTWTAAVPAADLSTLTDGTLSAAGTYTVAGGTITGTPLSVVKDTVTPDAPTSNPAPGAYEGTQAVVLHTADPDAGIHFTTNGTDPTKSSPTATGQISISSSQTVKAVAIDPAGNRSAVSSLAYTITPKAPATLQLPGTRVVIVQAPARERLALRSLSVRKTVTRKGLRRSGLRLGAQLASGTEVVRVRIYKGTRLITTAWQFPGRSGRYSAHLRSTKIRGLARGKYVIEVTPGTTRQSLGNAVRATFSVR